MKKREASPYLKMLLELKQEILKDMQANQEAGKEARQDEVQDLADQAASSYDRELASTLSETERVRLECIDKALARVDKGLYGICESCGKTIPLARLKALPFARFCVDCQIKEERAER